MARAIFRARARRLLGVLACAMTFVMVGCDAPLITIEILDFDSSAVEGIGVWRRSEQTGDWQLVSQVALTVHNDPVAKKELAYYDLTMADGSTVAMSTGVIREAGAPDHVTLSLFWNRNTAPGMFRATAFNAAGHSTLSREEVAL